MRKNEVVLFICANSLSRIQVGDRERNDTNLRIFTLITFHVTNMNLRTFLTWRSDIRLTLSHPPNCVKLLSRQEKREFYRINEKKWSRNFHLCKVFEWNSSWRKRKKWYELENESRGLQQGSLAEGEGSVQLTSLYQPV